MATIVNEKITSPGTQVLNSFNHGHCARILLRQGDTICRIVTSRDDSSGIFGNHFIEGQFWIDRESFHEIISRVNYDKDLQDLSSTARKKLAITTQFSPLANGLICVSLNADIYAWKGRAATMFEYAKNGFRIKYTGGLNQLWIPNLSPAIAQYSYFHSI